MSNKEMAALMPAIKLGVVGTSASLSAYIATFSFWGVSVLSVAPTDVLVRQWRHMYKIGAATAPFAAIACAAGYSFLAYTERNISHRLSWTSPFALYSIAAVTIPSIAPFTIFVMAPAVNDELMALAGKTDSGAIGDAVASKSHLTDLLAKWKTMNYMRAVAVASGTIMGAIAVLS